VTRIGKETHRHLGKLKHELSDLDMPRARGTNSIGVDETSTGLTADRPVGGFRMFQLNVCYAGDAYNVTTLRSSYSEPARLTWFENDQDHSC